VPLVYDSDFTILEYESNSSKERFSFGQISNIVALYQERLKRLGEIPELVDSFFVKDLDYPKELLKWRQSEWQEMPAILGQLIQLLQALKPEDWTEERLEQAIMPQAEQTGDRGKLLWPLRVALSGKQASAGPFEIAAVLGPEKTILRLKQAQTKLL
jgi:glutamyl/glutaminyl-tRNA synthetase